MASSIPSVLIIGATGTLGAHIAKSFQLPQYADKAKLSLLVRKETAQTAGPKKDALDALVKNGATLVFGDVSQSEAELTKAFSGVNILISAIGGQQLSDQLKLIPAAKAANVRWFVPSEFGYNVEQIGRGSVVPFFDSKLDVAEAVKAAGLDYTIFATGAFGEYVLSPFFGVDVANGTITAPGSFETPSSTTPLADIGVTVVDALLTGKGKNQVVYSGLHATYEQVAVAVEKATGKKLNRVVLSLADAEVAVVKNTYDYPARFAIILAKQQGKGTAWPESQTYAVKNGIKQQSLEEFVKKALSK